MLLLNGILVLLCTIVAYTPNLSYQSNAPETSENCCSNYVELWSNIEKNFNNLNKAVRQNVIVQKNELATLRQDFNRKINDLKDNCQKVQTVQGNQITMESLAQQLENHKRAILVEIAKLMNYQIQHDTNSLTNCAEAFKAHDGKDGVYTLDLTKYGLTTERVYCQQDPENGEPWLIIQRRVDNTINFDRNWYDYKNGFGDITGNYFIGLEKLNKITNAELHELWIQMKDFEGEERYAKYDNFAISDENNKYALQELGKYKGNAGDSLTIHKGFGFATKDADDGKYCAMLTKSAWWFYNCYESNLNGDYLFGHHGRKLCGIHWKTWHGYQYSLKYVHMAIRPVNQ